MLEEAMRWSKMDDGAKVRLAALQVASAALLASRETDVALAIDRQLPPDVLLEALDDASTLVSQAARELICTILFRGGTWGEKLIAPLRSWWDRRLGAPGAEGEPVPSYLIERRDGDEHAASRGPEPVLALALLVEDAAGTWDDEKPPAYYERSAPALWRAAWHRAEEARGTLQRA